MKIIRKEDLLKYLLDDVIQCPKCYNFLLLLLNDMTIKCLFCGYDMQYYTIKRHNTKLAEVVDALTTSLELLLELNYGIVIVNNNKKMLVRNFNKEIYIELIPLDLLNYLSMTHKKIVKIS